MITSANYMLFSRFNSLFVLTPSLKNSVLQLLLMKYSRSKVIRCLNVNFIRHFFLVRLLGSSDTNISVCAFFIKWMCKIFFIRMTDRLWTEVALAIAFEVNELKQSKDYFTLEHIFDKRIAKVAIAKACWNDDEMNFIWVVIVKRRLFKRKMLRTQSDKCAYEFVEITLRWERSWGQITECWACLN